MKYRVAICFLLLGRAFAAHADDVPSRIESVTVYPSGAIVTRVARVTLGAGDNDVRLVGLVSALDAATLRAEVAEGSVTIGQLRLDAVQARDAYDAEVARVQGEIDSLQRDIQATDDSTAAAARRLRFLDGLADSYARDAGPAGEGDAASVDTLRNALELLQSESETASALVRQNEQRKAELAKELSVLQRTLADLRGGSLASQVVELTLAADRALTTELRLSYFQANATWSPVYEARLDSDAGTLRLLQQARVEQQTDEDWNGVALTLSTAEPTGALQAPQLSPEFLSLEDPDRRREMVMMSAQRSNMPVADALEEVAVAGARRKIGNFAVSYDIPGATTVPNAADEALTLDVDAFDFDARLVTRIVPRSASQAFLVARFTQDQPVPLFGSDMRVFVDGVYAGVSAFPTALPGSSVELPMGQDRRVDVRVESQGGEGGQGGFLGRTQSEVTDFLFEITNRRATAADIEVLDRIPVARDRAIDVEIGDDATPATDRDVDDQPGLLRWRRSVAAGDSWRIRHQYSVTYPGDRELVTN